MMSGTWPLKSYKEFDMLMTEFVVCLGMPALAGILYVSMWQDERKKVCCKTIIIYYYL